MTDDAKVVLNREEKRLLDEGLWVNELNPRTYTHEQVLEEARRVADEWKNLTTKRAGA